MLDLSRVDRPVGGGSNQANAVVTYSPAFTLVPTYECFNRCSYCNFRVDPGQDRWLTLATAQARLENLWGKASEKF